MLKLKTMNLNKVLLALVLSLSLCSFTDSGEAGSGPHGKCNGKNENKCVITDADGTKHNYTGAYQSN